MLAGFLNLPFVFVFSWPHFYRSKRYSHRRRALVPSSWFLGIGVITLTAKARWVFGSLITRILGVFPLFVEEVRMTSHGCACCSSILFGRFWCCCSVALELCVRQAVLSKLSWIVECATCLLYFRVFLFFYFFIFIFWVTYRHVRCTCVCICIQTVDSGTSDVI